MYEVGMHPPKHHWGNHLFMKIRAFQVSDKPTIVNLLRLNTPKFFSPSEEKDLLEYLDHDSENYFAVEINGEVVGAGGVNYGFGNGLTARISWDIVHPNYQGKGIGTELLQYRISEVKKTKSIISIVVRTTQLAHEFYEKHGFRLEKVSEDFWAKGFDLYQMRMAL